MVAYEIAYQTRSKKLNTTREGDWRDKQSIVVAKENAVDAINTLIGLISKYHDFRLRNVTVIGKVSAIWPSIVIDQVNQEFQSTTELPTT